MKDLRTLAQSVLPPDYHAARRVQHQAEQRMITLSPPPPVDPELDPLSRGELTDAWVTAVIERQAQATLNDQERKVLVSLVKSATDQANAIYRLHVDAILTAYNNELQALLADVGKLSHKLGDVDTVNKAVAADKGREWKQLNALADDYAALRLAQHDLLSPEVKHAARARVGEPTASDLHLANLDQLWPDWRNPGQARSRLTQLGAGPREHSREEPWPADPVELLLWLVRSEARPWIPTAEQLQQVHEQRAASSNPNPRVIPHRPDEPGNWQPATRTETANA